MDIAINVLFGLSTALFISFVVLLIIYLIKTKRKSPKFNKAKWDKVLFIDVIVLFACSVISFVLTLVGIFLGK